MQIILPALGWQEPLYKNLCSSWITPPAGPHIASLTWAIAFVALWWVIVFVMDKRWIYLTL